MSGFKDWDQKDHAEEWIIFPENIGKHLSLDEVAITNGEENRTHPVCTELTHRDETYNILTCRIEKQFL